jgi:hypothetical protein
MPSEMTMQRDEHRSARCCPRCDGNSIARSRIRGWFGYTAKRVLGVRPYRCLDCWHRFVSTTSRSS